MRDPETVLLAEVERHADTIAHQCKEIEQLTAQLVKANERVKDRNKELVNRHNQIQELRQENGEYAILIANLVRRADVKIDLIQNPTIEKASEQLNKFALKQKIEALNNLKLKAVKKIHRNWIVSPMDNVESPGVDELMKCSVGLDTTMIDLEIEQLSKEQENV